MLFPSSQPSSIPFSLTLDQQNRLLSYRAAWEEGEDEERLERLRQREEDAETLQACTQLLAAAGLEHGGALTYEQVARLLALVRALAPNPNLDARLLRRPGEPDALNRDLHDLLYGPGSVPLRLRSFLTRRHAGGQTAMQLLCAAYPREWPLVTQAGLQALDLSPEQRQSALQTARQRFDLPMEVQGEEARTLRPVHIGVPDSDPVLRLLAAVVAYRAARDVLEADDYVSVHRLLTGAGSRGAGRRNRTLSNLRYGANPGLTTTVREPARPDYDPDSQSRPAVPGSSDRSPSESASEHGSSSLSAALPNVGDTTASTLLAYVESAIAAAGFTYPALVIRDYYISLQTKPFLILSGNNGIGKTRLTSLFAEILTADPAQYRILPVRPDWADATPLLGYVNLLARGGEGRAVSTPFLDFVRRALRPENANRAFFLCLDEMNLARVEHYFAEILSAMETQRRELTLPDGSELQLPSNLFITGAVNIDEATFSISRKVLDRANTIAFNEVYLREEDTEEDSEEDTKKEDSEETAKEAINSPDVALLPEIRQALFLYDRVTTPGAARARLKGLSGDTGNFARRVVNTLADANDILLPHHLQFAYRVRDEALIYCANSFDRDGNGLLSPDLPDDAAANLRTALDFQILQKVLPRLTGAQEQVETPLRDLLRWSEQNHFPRSARKLARMLTRLQQEGFVSYDTT